eukprot:m51a1_g4607 hypothetical protein (904) ;mRNA; f:244436-247804
MDDDAETVQNLGPLDIPATPTAPRPGLVSTDPTGVKRGECLAEGCECDQYRLLLDSKDWRCALCGHFPGEHKKAHSASPAVLNQDDTSAKSEDTETTGERLKMAKMWHKEKTKGIRKHLLPAGWKQRWFVLDPDKPQIRFYSWKMKPMGAVDLRLAKKVQGIAEKKGGFAYSFTIEGESDTLRYTLATDNPKEGKEWAAALEDILRKMPPPNQALLDKFQKVDIDHNWTLDFNEVRRLLRDMNVQVPVQEMHTKFDLVDTDHSDTLDYTEFEHLVSNLKHNAHMKQLFKELVPDEGNMTVEVLYNFLRDVQKEENVTMEMCMQIISNHKQDEYSAGGLLDVNGWTDYLSSPSENGPVNKSLSARIYQDMTRPLSHYFIASSNNTYLSGGQFTGQVTLSAIRHTLELGCRNIEIDIYDGTNKEPVIAKSSMGLSRCKLTDVLYEVRTNAFRTTMLPLILSLDMYCVDQQDIVAQRIKDILGDMLAPVFRLTTSDSLPSPSELLRKIIVMGKVHHEDLMQTAVATTTPKLEPATPRVFCMPAAMERPQRRQLLDLRTKPLPELDIFLQQQKLLPPELQPRELTDQTPSQSGLRLSGMTNKGVFEEGEEEEGTEEISAAASLGTGKLGKTATAKKKIKAKVSKYLSSMTHLATFPFPDLTAKGEKLEKAMRRPCYMISCIEDDVVDSLLKKHDTTSAAMQYNMYHLTRVYPKYKLMTSSVYNFDPVASWCCGCQMVALNYQTGSEPMWLNTAKFTDNGGCGYVLKPEWMIRGVEPTDEPQALLVRIISARQLPQIQSEIIDPFVHIQLHGHGNDKFDRHTKFIDNNGWDPVWEEEFVVPVSVPEMAVLSLTIMDHDIVGKNDFVANFSIALPLLKQGYRAVPLYDKDRRQLKGSHLFCFFSFPADV